MFAGLAVHPEAPAVRPVLVRDAKRGVRLHAPPCSSWTTARSCCRAGCASCAAWSTPKTCRSTCRASCCRTPRWCARSKQVIRRVLDLLSTSRRTSRTTTASSGPPVRRGAQRGPALRSGDGRDSCQAAPLRGERRHGQAHQPGSVPGGHAGEGKAIYYVTAPSKAVASQSPFLERVRQKNYDVLYMTDAVDPFAVAGLSSTPASPSCPSPRGSEAGRRRGTRPSRSPPRSKRRCSIASAACSPRRCSRSRRRAVCSILRPACSPKAACLRRSSACCARRGASCPRQRILELNLERAPAAEEPAAPGGRHTRLREGDGVDAPDPRPGPARRRLRRSKIRPRSPSA